MYYFIFALFVLEYVNKYLLQLKIPVSSKGNPTISPVSDNITTVI